MKPTRGFLEPNTVRLIAIGTSGRLMGVRETPLPPSLTVH
jgi:hypothetical protein